MAKKYSKKTGRACVGVEAKKKQMSKDRGELVQINVRVQPRVYEWLQRQSEMNCVSMGQVLDWAIFAYNCHEWKKR